MKVVRNYKYEIKLSIKIFDKYANITIQKLLIIRLNSLERSQRWKTFFTDLFYMEIILQRICYLF